MMILNGVNDETRIKVSGRQREWSFRNCTHTSSCFRPAVHNRIDFIENILLPVIQKQ